MPEYFKTSVYYARACQDPGRHGLGIVRPHDAGRMDPYVDLFQSQGGSLVMVAKATARSR